MIPVFRLQNNPTNMHTQIQKTICTERAGLKICSDLQLQSRIRFCIGNLNLRDIYLITKFIKLFLWFLQKIKKQHFH